jgi:hypothetical protein
MRSAETVPSGPAAHRISGDLAQQPDLHAAEFVRRLLTQDYRQPRSEHLAWVQSESAQTSEPLVVDLVPRDLRPRLAVYSVSDTTAQPAPVPYRTSGLRSTCSETCFCQTRDVLDRVEERCGLGSRYALPLLADLVAVWVRHLPLLEGEGNWAQIDGDPPADARYTKLALSAVGKLALAAERGQVGPVPLGIIEGGLYRGGPVPPFDPAEILEELMDEMGRYCMPSMPTGTVSGDIDRLLRGKQVRLQLGARIRGGPGEFVITSPPFRVSTATIASNIQDRVTQAFRSLPEGYFESFVAAE